MGWKYDGKCGMCARLDITEKQWGKFWCEERHIWCELTERPCYAFEQARGRTDEIIDYADTHHGQLP